MKITLVEANLKKPEELDKNSYYLAVVDDFGAVWAGRPEKCNLGWQLVNPDGDSTDLVDCSCLYKVIITGQTVPKRGSMRRLRQ